MCASFLFLLCYRYVVPKPRDECTKGEQLVVTFGAGYIAGVFCAIVSHPADTVVSKLNQNKGASAMDIVKKLGLLGTWYTASYCCQTCVRIYTVHARSFLSIVLLRVLRRRILKPALG